MPETTVWILEKSNVTVSGGGSLDGITRGDANQLAGRTITLNAPSWKDVRLTDDDANFDDNDGGQRLFGAQTIDGVTYANNTVVEAEYSVTLTDPATGVTYRVIGFNIVNSNPAFATTEGLAFIGPQSGWPPTGVPLIVTATGEGPSGGTATSYASYVTPACFTPGTRIATPDGLRRVQDLAAGDLVLTLDDGAQPVLLVARTHLEAARLQREPELRPVVIPQNALGPGQPDRDMQVSPQHRFLQRGPACELQFAEHEVLVAAKDLPVARTVPLAQVPDGVTYLHLVFARHQVLLADRVECESFLLGPAVYRGATAAMQAELRALFPDLSQADGPKWPISARMCLTGREARLLAA